MSIRHRRRRTGGDGEHDYRSCQDENYQDEGCRSYRAGRAAGYESGFMRGAADGFEHGRARTLGLDDDACGDS